MSLLESINKIVTELGDIDQKSRDLAMRKAELLKSLSDARAHIQEVIEKSNVVPATATPISTIPKELDKHTCECLESVDIKFLEDITKMTKPAVQAIPLLGSNGLSDICDALRTRGLSFAT